MICACVVLFLAPVAAAQTGAVVPHDRTAAVQLATVEQQMTEGSHQAAAEFLQQIAVNKGGQLVRVGPRHLVRVRDRCLELMRRLPPTELAALREGQEATAKSWLRRAKADEPGLLQRILRDAPLTTSAGEALFLLGSRAWQDGDPGLAYEYWRRLLPTPVNSPTPQDVTGNPLTPAEVGARLVLCRIAMNDTQFARRELAGFREAFSDAEGTLAGSTGKLSKILAKQLEVDWSPPTTEIEAKEWQRVWSRPATPLRAAIARPVRKEPPRQRIVFAPNGGYVFDGTRVGQLDLEKPNQNEPTWLNPGPDVSARDVVSFRRRLLMQLERAEPRSAVSSELVCVDAGNSRILWRMKASDIVPDAAFETAPTCWHVRGFVVLRTSGNNGSLHLCGLSLTTGETLFRTLLCSGLETAPAAVAVRPLVSTTHVSIVTNNGVVIATDHDGQLAWATEYSRTATHRAVTTGTAQDGWIVAAPADSDAVIAIREHTGGVVWRTRLPDDIQHVVGVQSGTCIVSGRAPWGLEFATGRVRWGLPRHVPERFGFGRPTIVGDLLLFPTRESIEARQILMGELCGAGAPGAGGNLSFDAPTRRLGIGSDYLRVMQLGD